MSREVKGYSGFQEDTVEETREISFGLELEVVHPAVNGKIGDDNKHIKESISDAKNKGLTDATEMDSGSEGKWKPVSDGTLTTKSDNIHVKAGIEWVSPILYTKDSDWKSIGEICNVIKNNQGEITDACSEHIHLGKNKLTSEGVPSIDKHKGFYFLYEGFQEIIDVIARSNFGSPPRERMAVEKFAKKMELQSSPVIPVKGKETPSEYNRKVFGALFNVDPDKRWNALNVATKKTEMADDPTIEIRRFNGTFDPKVIQANVLLSTALMNTASKKTLVEITTLVNNCKGKGIRDKLIGFVDFITNDDKIKEAIIKSYNVNSSTCIAASVANPDTEPDDEYEDKFCGLGNDVY